MEERGARAAAETEAAELEGRLIAAEEAAAANAERAGRAAEAAEAAQDLVSRTMGRREEERAAALEVTEELDALRTRLQAAEAAEVAAAGRATRAAEDSKEEAEARRRAEGSRAEAEAEAQTAVAALAEAEAARAAAEEARAAAEERQAEARVLLGQTVEAAEVEVAKAESATAAAEEVLPASLPALHCRPTADQPPSSRGPGLPCSRRLTVAAYRRSRMSVRSSRRLSPRVSGWRPSSAGSGHPEPPRDHEAPLRYRCLSAACRCHSLPWCDPRFRPFRRRATLWPPSDCRPVCSVSDAGRLQRRSGQAGGGLRSGMMPSQSGSAPRSPRPRRSSRPPRCTTTRRIRPSATPVRRNPATTTSSRGRRRRTHRRGRASPRTRSRAGSRRRCR